MDATTKWRGRQSAPPISGQVIRFAIPATFSALDALPPALRRRAEEACWLVSTIGRKIAHRDTDTHGYATLHSDILRRIMGDDYKKIRVALGDAGVIEVHEGYQPGVKAKGYRLGHHYAADRCVIKNATDFYLMERIRRDLEKIAAEQTGRWHDIHYSLDDMQQSLTLDKSADKILDELPPYTKFCQSFLVAHIRQNLRSFSVGSTGRVFNCFTGVKRELRSAGRIDGKDLGNVDIRCAQPNFLSWLLKWLLDQKCPPKGLKGSETYKLAGADSLFLPPACSSSVCSSSLLRDRATL